MYKCPVCKSTNVSTSGINEYSQCCGCGFRDKTREFKKIDPKEELYICDHAEECNQNCTSGMAHIKTTGCCCKSCNFFGEQVKCIPYKEKEEATKMYDYEFKDLFESERAAVVSYLSLERRYHILLKLHKEEMA